MLSESPSATSRRRTARPPERGSLLRAIADSLLAVLIAPACAACGTTLERPTRGAVCQSCWDAVVPLTPPLCRRCGEPLTSWRRGSADASDCPRCLLHPSTVDRAAAIGRYDGRLRDILHAFKYGKRESLARPLAGRMAASAGHLLEGVDLVIPVPLHPRRRRARGFNQAEALARRLGPRCVAALRRTRMTPSQTDLPAAERAANVAGAFALRARHDVAGATVLIVDDVSTTGATVEACAQVLRQAGVREVRALTAARVVTIPR